MAVTGEEGVTIADFVVYQKARIVDLCYLQQDAFDPVDVTCPLPRQRRVFERMHRLAVADEHILRFDDKDQVREFFTRLASTLRNYNYAAEGSAEHDELLARIDGMLGGGGK